MPALGAVEISEADKHAALIWWLCQVLNTNGDALLPFHLTKREPDATGQCLSDRMVSRSEIVLALERLPVDEEAVIRMAYGPSKYSQAEIGRIVGKSERTVRRYITNGIERMKDRIFDL